MNNAPGNMDRKLLPFRKYTQRIKIFVISTSLRLVIYFVKISEMYNALMDEVS